ncbi:MAG: hypothetical protein AAFN94_18435, partial [Pseudomonadota bacterium]
IPKGRHMTESLIDTAVYAELMETMGADFAAELLTTFLDDTDAPWTALLSALPKLHRTPESAFTAALPIIDAAWTALRSDATT